MTSESRLTDSVIQKAKALGASVAGIARLEDLKRSPSNMVYPCIGSDLKKHLRDAQGNRALTARKVPDCLLIA